MTKRTLMALALATTTAFSVVACGSDTAEDTTTAASSAAAETTSPADATTTVAESTSETAPTSEEATSESQTSEAAALPADVISAETDPEFAALLSTNDNCSQALVDYATANAGRTVQFDGYVANIVRSDNGGQRVLVNPGVFDPASTPVGPSFQYTIASMDDLNITAGNASSVTIGHGGTFTAKLGQFDSESCLLPVDPVSTVLD